MPLHIVSFNVPYPADYGGVIDVYHRIRALHNLGVDIHLHTFTYGRNPAPKLEALCSEVTYYPRRTGLISAISRKPYIVRSRQNSQLIDDLSNDNDPILLEGLHCCSVLETLTPYTNTPYTNPRTILVRAHNVEHEYYDRLADAEKRPLRRLYLRTDARRLRRYEPILLKATAVLAVTESDADHFRSIGCRNVVLMPSSHPDDHVTSIPSPFSVLSPSKLEGVVEDRGRVSRSPFSVPRSPFPYALYHADLSVPENIQTIKYLAQNILPNTDTPFVVAGRNPSTQITALLAPFPNVTLVPNPDDDTMHALIRNAQVLLLLTAQPTGLKLKLLNSLYAGRHCLVNSAMVAGTPLGQLCTVADSADLQLQALHTLMQTPFTKHDIDRRSALLGTLYSNDSNARILISLL